MKRIVTSFLAALLAVSISQAFSAYDPGSESGLLTVKMYPGWNLVPLLALYTSGKGEFNTCGADLGAKSLFVWSPTERKYVGGKADEINKPDSEASRILKRDTDSGYYYAQPGSSGFIYRTGPECSYTLRLGQSTEEPSLPKLKIVKGWNFIVLKPWMMDKAFTDFTGTCEITHAFLFDASSQKWSGGSVTKSDLEGSVVTVEHVGKILAMKFANDCNFAVKATTLVPPALPSD